ncbi:hypothetical protein PNOK_0253100 [Pyrrhoderma noxium]|uniref:Uncharacterized protein n=1 Tax=Pyrrhoderma noxium TaxID=2282107 RepID=A0A286USP7_9AGAM|nr:hypothetical protein PNOK_0253100 [Pyrrhoderma noxium]
MPRSILKQSSSSSSDSYSTTSLAAALPYPPPPPQVHFPPPTSLTQTHYTHSGTHYDRAPIVVLPNDCALPERGCPGPNVAEPHILVPPKQAPMEGYPAAA